MKSSVAETHRQSIVHPNMDGEGSDDDSDDSSGKTGKIKGFKKKQKKNFGYYFKKFDYEILRPLFIHDYDRKKMQKEDELA